jgi:hypothetical protein
MVVARMGVWGKGQQSLAPPQHAVTPVREQRFGLKPKIIAACQRTKDATGAPERKRYAV